MEDKIVELRLKQEKLSEKIIELQEFNKRNDAEAIAIREVIEDCKNNLRKIKELVINGETGQISVKDVGRSATSIAEGGGKGETDKVTCRVDLNTMKIKIKGPSEDLKELDATQLINLLDKFECQELIITTGLSDEEISIKVDEPDSAQGPDKDDSRKAVARRGGSIDGYDGGDIPVIYLLHPGNVVMIAGISMVSFLVTANLCKCPKGPATRFLYNSVYIISLVFHYGMVLFMTFIRGYTLNRRLSRGTFISMDNVLLQRHYAISVLLSAVMLYSFLTLNCVPPCESRPFCVIFQIMGDITTFLLELGAICYLVPAVIRLRRVTQNGPPPGTSADQHEKNMEKLQKLDSTITFINVSCCLLLGTNIYYLIKKLDLV